MKTLVIEQKTGGNIHDIASDQYDRVIKFRKGTRYAVVLSSFYGDQYTTHKTEEAAMLMAARKRAYSLQIIDAEGNLYDDQNGSLEMIEV